MSATHDFLYQSPSAKPSVAIAFDPRLYESGQGLHHCYTPTNSDQSFALLVVVVSTEFILATFQGASEFTGSEAVPNYRQSTLSMR